MENLPNRLTNNKLYVFLLLFCMHNALLSMQNELLSMDKKLDEIDRCNQKIKAKQKQLENIDDIRIFKKNSDQKSVALLKSRIHKEIELYSSKKNALVSKL